MHVKKKQLILVALIVVLLFAGGYALGQSRYAPLDLRQTTSTADIGDDEAFRPFRETLKLIRADYFEQS